MESVFQNETIKAILEKYRRIWAIGHAQSVLGWDMEVNMPKEGILERSVAQGSFPFSLRSSCSSPSSSSLSRRPRG